ncbi:predicted protein [Arabidopsis lyrata subsp. lyrata]|uniref:Predicted protein n=1 Tax=Arabidopsis lyrata subsp. lyrata TaxID=81972 RepID=D7M9E5_ARALL|nr:predicted protein [Arabidopsis lyrata subsp. lyrata]
MESKKKQLYENLRDLKNAVQVRMDNKTTTAAELDASAEKLLKNNQCILDHSQPREANEPLVVTCGEAECKGASNPFFPKLIDCCMKFLLQKHNFALHFRSFIHRLIWLKALDFDSSSAVSDMGFAESETGSSTRVLGKSASWIFIFFREGQEVEVCGVFFILTERSVTQVT